MRVALYLHFPYLHFPPLQIRTCVFQYLRFQRPRVCVLGIHVRCIAQTEGRIASRFRPLGRQTRDGTKLQYALDGV